MITAAESSSFLLFMTVTRTHVRVLNPRMSAVLIPARTQLATTARYLAPSGTLRHGYGRCLHLHVKE